MLEIIVSAALMLGVFFIGAVLDDSRNYFDEEDESEKNEHTNDI